MIDVGWREIISGPMGLGGALGAGMSPVLASTLDPNSPVEPPQWGSNQHGGLWWDRAGQQVASGLMLIDERPVRGDKIDRIHRAIAQGPRMMGWK